MSRSVAALVISAFAIYLAPLAGAAMPEIVVSMRYLQQNGTSHAHLYLYREDGKMLRQLTDADTGQDRAPVFAPDGVTIVFTRDRDDDSGHEYYSVAPRGGHLHRLAVAPAWYVSVKKAEPIPVDSLTRPDSPTVGASFEDQTDALARLAPRQTVNIDSQPAISQPVSLQEVAQNPDHPHLNTPPLQVSFFTTHMDSTDGDTVFALSSDGKQITRLAFHYTQIYALPGEAAFMTWTSSRYVPFGDGKRTANCTYLEYWDAELKPNRYAKAQAAGICGGASIYRPGMQPRVIVFDEP